MTDGRGHRGGVIPDQYKPIDPLSSGIYQDIAHLRRLAERDDAPPEMLRAALLCSLGASEELLQALDYARNLLAEIGKRLLLDRQRS